MQEAITQYYMDVWWWRTTGSVVWTVLSLPPVTLLFLLLVQADLLHPVDWIAGCLWSTLSFTTWLYLMILAIVISFSCFFMSSQFSVQPVILTSRWAVLWNLIRPNHLCRFLVFALAGAMATWCGLNIHGGDYVGLTRPCGEDGKSVCLNEPHLFVVAHGLFLGVAWVAAFYLDDQGYMPFPIIQQAKFFSVKSQLWQLLYRSGVCVLRRMRVFYLLYFCLGRVPKQWIEHTLSLSESDVAVDSVRGLMDVGLFWHTWLSGCLVCFLFQLSALLFKVYQTESYQFAVESSFEEKGGTCLHNALSCSTKPLIQYIGFQDLFMLAKCHEMRRRAVFSLSQPGGHPHNWTSVSVECLSTIDNLTNSIVAFNNNAIANGNIRNLSGERLAHKEAAYSCTPAQTLGSSVNPAPAENKTKQASGSFFSSLWQQVKKRPFIAFLVSDLPDTTSRRLFADSQKHIWAVEALSHLVVASYTEDQFGVVQKSLADILTALLNLLDAVDKHFILATNMTRRPPRGADHSSDVTLRFALRSALKSALYRIVIRFDKHLEFIQLTPEHRRRLGMFLDFKE